MRPAEFARAVREVHAKRRASPDGWPWTRDPILNHGYFLDDLRDQHFVTAELLREAADLSTKEKMNLRSLCVIDRAPGASPLGARRRSKMATCQRPSKDQWRLPHAPYRCVMRKDHLGSVVEKVASSAAFQTPFPNLGEANTFFKSRILGVATDTAYVARQTPFCAAEVAR